MNTSLVGKEDIEDKIRSKRDLYDLFKYNNKLLLIL